MVTTITGDALTELTKLPDQSVHCIVTSPPYYGLRDYGIDEPVSYTHLTLPTTERV